MSEMNAKLCVGKSIPSDVLTYLKAKTDVLKEQYANAEKYFVLSGYTNHNHDTIGQLRQRVQQQDETLQKFLNVLTAYLEDKLTKKQASERAKSIVTEYGRELSDREAKEEQLGRSLTDEEYERVKDLKTPEQILKELEEDDNDSS